MGLELRDVTKAYDVGDKKKKVLDEVSLTIEDGELVAICGKSGAGKSTLIHMLGLLDKPDSGKILIDEVDASSLSEQKKAAMRNKKLGFVLQDFGLIEGETAYNNVRVPLLLGSVKFGQIDGLVSEKLKELDIYELAEKDVTLLSGGEKQRVAIARAIVNNPDYILADEPTGSLDSANAANVMGILKKLNKEGKTVVIVTHDLEIANMCDRIIHIKDGKTSTDKTNN
jgi:putative ABC transport system ATP-binding protein